MSPPTAVRTGPSTLQSFTRFGGLTVLSAALSFGVTIGLHEGLGVGAPAAYAVALVTAFVANFVLMRYLVFNAADGPLGRQLGLHALSTCGFRGAEYVLFLLLHVVAGVHYLLTMILVQGTATVAKFVFYRGVVFAGRRSRFATEDTEPTELRECGL